MSQNVPATFQVAFKNAVEMELQQGQDILVNATTVQYDSGAEKVKVKDLVGNNEGHEATDRHGDTQYSDTGFDGVWVAKQPEVYDADLIDNDDKLQTKIDLQGSTMMSLTATVKRWRTRRVLQGFYGDVISGKNGTITTAFPNGNIIPVTTGGASGAQKMNVAKLIEAGVMLGEAYVAPELQRFMVLTAQDNRSLLNEVPVTSADFKGSYRGEVDGMGMVRSLLGWNFLYVELDNPLLGDIPDLATDGSGYRKTPFWVKPGLVTNYWQESRTMLDVLPQKRGSVQAFVGSTLAATRTQAGMSGIILNAKG